jgi:ubiquinone/menaquinone biosynthesis C-methylase UbiE
MNDIQHFDEHAATWDADPARIARTDAIAEAIRGAVPLGPDMCVLEYGCGTGMLSFALFPRLQNITLADSSEGMLAVLRRKIENAGAKTMRPIKLDLAQDPLPSEKFELIYTALTLHHIADIDGILRSFSALLTSHGHLCIIDLDREDGSFHGPDMDVHHGFDRAELGRKAEEAGFSKVRFSTIYTLTKQDAAGAHNYSLFLLVAEKP